MIIFPTGILQGERLAQCSDDAQLHFPRLVALANGFGRVELQASRIIELAYEHLKVKPTKTQLTDWVREYRDNHLLFIYKTGNGAVWGQWCMPKNALPRHKTAADNRSPAPIASEFEAFAEGYQQRKRAKAAEDGDYLKVSEEFGNLPKSLEGLEAFPRGVGSRFEVIGVGKEQRLLSGSDETQSSDVGDPGRFLQAWNDHCGALKKIIKLTAERRKKLGLRVKDGLDVERFTEAVKIAASTPFLRGEGGSGTWKCDFDFLTKNETNLLKVLEGKYGEPDQPKAVFVEVPAEQWLGGESLA